MKIFGEAVVTVTWRDPLVPTQERMSEAAAELARLRRSFDRLDRRLRRAVRRTRVTLPRWHGRVERRRS